MKFTGIITAGLFGATALAAPTANKASVEIKGFTETKPDGYATEDISFTIVPSGGASISCASYNLGGTAIEKFKAETTYSCGHDSPYLWSYKFGDPVSRTSGRLFLWQKISETEKLAGQASVAELTDCTTGKPAVCKQGTSLKVVIDLS